MRLWGTHSLVCLDGPVDEALDGAVVWKLLETHTVAEQNLVLHLLLELSHSVGGEAELAGNEHLLTAGELETTSVHRFFGVLKELGFGSH